MLIENMETHLENLEEAVSKLDAAVEQVLIETFIVGEEDAPLSQQVKDVEETVANLELIGNQLHEAFNVLVNTISYEIGTVYREHLIELRQRYLEEETDTPREAAENIEKVLPTITDNLLRGKLQAALKYLLTQIPPTVEEIEYIPFETARIDDPTLEEGTEQIEVKGVDGEYTVTYEVTEVEGEEVREEIGRELTKQPVTAVIRVGTKEAEVELEE